MGHAHVSYNDGNGQEETREKRGQEESREKPSSPGDGSDAEQEAVTGPAPRDRAEGSGGAVGGQGFVYFIETEDGRFVNGGEGRFL
jgi:hypothetical protein